MPQMVMSHLPKNHAVFTRRRLKGGKDNIMRISYIYVGIPKTKFTFYVRERLVYRSNVEVTYDEVFNYLSQICNDLSISLHYAINNQYVSITTTGQLHTFLQHLHSDPNMYLYLENKDYVWNVKPKSKANKKKNTVNNIDDTPQKRKCGCNHDHDEDDEEITSDEDSSDMSDQSTVNSDESLDGEEEDSSCEYCQEKDIISTGNYSREKGGFTPVERDTSACSAESTGSAQLGAEENDSDEQISSYHEPEINGRTTLCRDMVTLKEFIFKQMNNGDLPYGQDEFPISPYSELIALKLIKDNWPPHTDINPSIYEKTVPLLAKYVVNRFDKFFGLKTSKIEKGIPLDRFVFELVEQTLIIIENRTCLNDLLQKADDLKRLDVVYNEKIGAVEQLPPLKFVRNALVGVEHSLNDTLNKCFSKANCDCLKVIHGFHESLKYGIRLLDQFDNTTTFHEDKYKCFISRIKQFTSVFLGISCARHVNINELVEEVQLGSSVLKLAKEIGTSPVKEKPEKRESKPIEAKKLSPQAQEHVDNMLKIPQHAYVYPPAPLPGKIMVPTGGLARCRCSKTCTFSLNEPEYAYLERFNEPRQTLWEKTKQKRFKKN